MVPASLPFPAGRTCFEASKKAAICLLAAIALCQALPYSARFTFETMTYLSFTVAFTEGALSVLADLLGHPAYGTRKIIEAIETLIASAAVALTTVAVISSGFL
jgi:hypothetical protein